MRPFRALLLALMVSVGLLVPTAEAAADGLPVGGLNVGREGVADGSGSRYVTFGALGGTVVARIDTRDGTVEDWMQTRGKFTIPAVAYDGTPAGLSADGDTLVLIKPRPAFPRRSTSLYVIDTRNRLTPVGPITLRGDFSFDAISPAGETIYLVHYLSRRDQTRYEVRALDVDSGRLIPGPIVDPTEPDERMAGVPVSRATSPDGRWAYTLYDALGHEPFIHALDTSGMKAVCIDLARLEGRTDVGLMRLEVDPGSGALTVLSRRPENPKSRPLLNVDPSTFEVSAASADTEESAGDGSGIPAWWLLAAGVAGLAVAILLAGGLRPARGGRDRGSGDAGDEVASPG